MVTVRNVNLIIFTLGISLIFGVVDSSKAERIPDFPNASGRELIHFLLNADTRDHAYQELSLRANTKTEKDFDQFKDTHRNPEVIVCPQLAGREPLYAVLSDFLSNISGPTLKSDPPRIQNNPLARRNQLLIDVFNANGEKVNPFPENDNVLEGIMTDMNHDGIVERANDIRYGVEGVKNAQVLRVGRMLETEQIFFSILYNWGDQDDWDYAFSDKDQDGFVEIDFGPLTENGVLPKITFHWDAKSETFITNNGLGTHLYLLNIEQSSCAGIQKLGSSLAPFQPDPEALDQWDRIAFRQGKVTEKEKSKQIKSTAYRFSSLKGSSNDQIMEFMGHGKESFDIEMESTPPNVVPDSFWTSPSEEAGRQLVEANRSTEHRRNFSIHFDARNIQHLPDRFAITLSEGGAHWDRQLNYYLRADPEDSYLAFAARSLPSYLEPESLLYEPLCWDFRLCKISYSDAHRIGEVIMALHQIRTISGDSNSPEPFIPFSTGDGEALLQVILRDGTIPVSLSGKIGGRISEGWVAGFGSREIVGLLEEILSNGFVGRTGECRRQFERSSCGIGPPRLVDQFLGMYSLNQDQLSYKIVYESVAAAGDYAMSSEAAQLQSLKKQLESQTVRSTNCNIREEVTRVKAERDQLEKAVTSENALATLKNIETKDKEISKLYDRLTSIEFRGIQECASENLKGRVELSLHQIDAGTDAVSLVQWIRAKEDHWDWALGQLRKINSLQYVQALKELFATTSGREKAEILSLIDKADHNEGIRAAKEIDAADDHNLFLAAFTVLTNETELIDAERLQPVIEILQNPGAEYEERMAAFECLVPRKDPARFKNGLVDKTLLRLLQMKPAPDYGFAGTGEAALALYSRHGTQYFDEILAFLENGDFISFPQILKVLEAMTPKLTPSQKALMGEAIRPYFKNTDGLVSDIVWAVWASDLRTLQKEVEDSATGQASDVQNDECESWQNGRKKFSGRCHISRQIATLWNEQDPVTRVKLMLSLYVQNPHEFDNRAESNEIHRMKKLQSDFHKDILSLDSQQREEIRSFIDWADKTHPFSKYEIDYQPQRERLMQFVQKDLETKVGD